MLGAIAGVVGRVVLWLAKFFLWTGPLYIFLALVTVAGLLGTFVVVFVGPMMMRQVQAWRARRRTAKGG